MRISGKRGDGRGIRIPNALSLSPEFAKRFLRGIRGDAGGSLRRLVIYKIVLYRRTGIFLFSFGKKTGDGGSPPFMAFPFRA